MKTFNVLFSQTPQTISVSVVFDPAPNRTLA
jgi:hypothetical protein